MSSSATATGGIGGAADADADVVDDDEDCDNLYGNGPSSGSIEGNPFPVHSF